MSTTNADTTDSTDAEPDTTPEPEAVAAALRARNTIEDVPSSAYGDHRGEAWNAAEQLEQIIIDAVDDPATLSTAGEIAAEDAESVVSLAEVTGDAPPLQSVTNWPRHPSGMSTNVTLRRIVARRSR